MSKKFRIGIDINEVLRARWLQFDRFYDNEFGGGEDSPPAIYTYDFFKDYPWKDTVEITKDLKEPGDMPDNINPLDYQPSDELDGEAPADLFLFKAPVKKTLTAREVYNRFMYEDFVFEIHGSAPMMYKNMDLEVNEFYFKYKDFVDFVIISKENQFSIPSTLLFLSKIRTRFTEYRFSEDDSELCKGLDLIITTDPELIEYVKNNTLCETIKLKRPYNEQSYNGIMTPVLQVNDLNGNPEFEKIINYVAPPEVIEGSTSKI